MSMIDQERNPPHEVYKETWDWIVASQAKSSSVHKVYQEYQVKDISFFTLPKSVDQNMYWKFEWEKKRKPPREFSAIISYGRVYGSHGVVITPDNKLLWDISYEYGKSPGQHSIFQQKVLPPVKTTSETVAVLTFVASHNYYHWMFDVLSRIDILRRCGIEVDKYIINCHNSFCFQEETLKALGIPKEKMITCDHQFHLKADKMIVTSLPGFAGHMAKWTYDFLRKELMNNQHSDTRHGWERIYISRSNSSGRKVRNEDQVMNLLTNYGFKSFTLESMTVQEQIQLFSSAKIIISPHGAALTNLLFCNPGTKVIEFFSPNYVNLCYWILSNHANLEYYYLIGEGQLPPVNSEPHLVYDHISINLEALKKITRMTGIE